MKALDRRKAVQVACGPFYEGEIDGEFGPKFFAGIAELKDAVDQPGASAPLASTIGALLRAQMVVEFAKLIGGRETDGANQSPAIDALWAYTSYEDGWRNREPYCAATVCAVAHRAAIAVKSTCPLPISPSCAGMLEWAQDARNQCLLFTPAEVAAGQQQIKAGDIVSFLPRLSHTGLVRTDYAGNGMLDTSEGNTNGAGERDGDGFWNKTRPLSLAGHFIRLGAA